MSIWKELTNPSTSPASAAQTSAAQVSAAFAAPTSAAQTSPAQTTTPATPLVRTEPQPLPTGSLGKSHKPIIIESFIDSGTTIEGKIEADGDLRIAGLIKGDIFLKGNLTLDPAGRIVGTVSAASVVVAGEVEGNIHASANVNLLETSRVIGDLKAKYVTAAIGSRVRGKVEFGWEESPEKARQAKERIEPTDREFVGPLNLEL